MNTIQAVVGKSEFVPEPHLQFIVDGVSLDAILSAAHPDRNLGGMIPTTLNWLEKENEQKEVWSRFTDRRTRRLLIPIPCCPDDLDFSCAVVVVDARLEDNVVHWTRFGLDATPSVRLPTGIGSVADWLSDVGLFVFDRAGYDQMVSEFENQAKIESAG